MWPFVTQRPFNKVANPSDNPKSIIVSLANTAPLSVDYNFTLASNKDSIVSALINLKKLVHQRFNEDGPWPNAEKNLQEARSLLAESTSESEKKLLQIAINSIEKSL